LLKNNANIKGFAFGAGHLGASAADIFTPKMTAASNGPKTCMPALFLNEVTKAVNML
jgi:hypothetical protein